MPSHKFHIGDSVMLKLAISRNVPGGVYEVIKQLPHRGTTVTGFHRLPLPAGTSFPAVLQESFGSRYCSLRGIVIDLSTNDRGRHDRQGQPRLSMTHLPAPSKHLTRCLRNRVQAR
jgi:hypothetical protein